jgi:hypothetical protein
LECWWSFGSHRCKHCRNVFDQSRRTQQLNSSSGTCTPGNLSHALDTSEVNQIRGKMERWSLEEFGWLKNSLFAKCFNQNCSYLVNSLNVVLTLLFADCKTSCKTKNRDRTPTQFFYWERGRLRMLLSPCFGVVDFHKWMNNKCVHMIKLILK